MAARLGLYVVIVLIGIAVAACSGVFGIEPKMGEDGRVVFVFHNYREEGPQAIDICGLRVARRDHGQWVEVWAVGRKCSSWFDGGITSMTYGDAEGLEVFVAAQPLVPGQRYVVTGTAGPLGGTTEFKIENGTVVVFPPRYAGDPIDD